MRITKKFLFFSLLFIIFPSLVYSDSLTNQITEPTEPANVSSLVIFTVRSLFDFNQVSAYANVPNGSFEIGTVPPTTNYWSMADKGTQCGMQAPTTRSFLDCSTVEYLGCDGTYGAFRESQSSSSPTNLSWLVCSSDVLNGCEIGSQNKVNAALAEGKCVAISNSTTLSSYDLNNLGDANKTGGIILNLLLLNSQVTPNSVSWQTNLINSSFNLTTNMRLRFLAGRQIKNGINVDENILIDKVQYATLTPISNYVGADCNFSFNSGAFVSMALAGDTNTNSYGFTTPSSAGDYNYAISCRSGTTIAYNEGVLQVRVLLGGNLEIDNVDNISHTINNYNVDLVPSNKENDFRFSAKNLYSGSLIVDYNIYNQLDDGKQYYIYTSTSDANYTFNDTLTYGGTYPVQKIWDNANGRYRYSFSDTLLTGQTKYYKLAYAMPLRSWKTISNSDEWLTELSPTISNINGQNWELYTLSNVNNIRNYFLLPLPYTDQSAYRSFEIQFTAYTNYGTTTINTGLVKGDNLGSITFMESAVIAVNETPKRFSLTFTPADFSNDNKLVIYTNITGYSSLFITDYSISGRSYFSKRLTMKQPNYEALPIIILNNSAYPYVQENKAFRAISELYDFEGDINSLLIQVFRNSISSATRIKQEYITLDIGREEFFNTDYLVNNFVDMTTTTSQTLLVIFTVMDSNNIPMSTQSGWVTFLPFPFFPSDSETYATQEKYKVGESPKGFIQYSTSSIDSFIGMQIKIWKDTNSFSVPTYTKIIDKPQFTCVGGDCEYYYELTDFAFEKQALYHFAFVPLFNTQYIGTATLNDWYIYYTTTNVYLKQFTTARVLQTRERTDNPSLYKNYEKIGFVLELKDTELSNLKDSLTVYLKLLNCDAQSGGNCIEQNKKYYHSAFIYDNKEGYNYWYFNQIYTLDNGNLLPDGNYIQAHAVITLTSQDINNYYAPALAKRCKAANYDLDHFSATALGIALDPLGYLATGCIGGYLQEQIVTLMDNNSQIDRIKIDNSYSPTLPTQELFVCVNADENNIYVNSFKQRLVCLIWGTVGEVQPDKMKLYITNQYSELSKKENKQYIEFEIPYEILLYQQPLLLKKYLDSKNTSKIVTIGQFAQDILNNAIAGFSNLTIEAIDTDGDGSLDSLTNTIPNVGFDVNLSKAFSPTNISFAFVYLIDGVRVVNINDFDLENTILQPKNFIQYAIQNKLRLPADKDTYITVFGNNFEELYKTKQSGYIVIREQENTEKIIKVTDLNNNFTYETAPNIINLYLISDFVYNSGMGTIRNYITLKLKANIKNKVTLDDMIEGIGECIDDPAKCGTSFLFQNITIITIIFIIIIFFAIAIALIMRK